MKSPILIFITLSTATHIAMLGTGNYQIGLLHDNEQGGSFIEVELNKTTPRVKIETPENITPDSTAIHQIISSMASSKIVTTKKPDNHSKYTIQPPEKALEKIATPAPKRQEPQQAVNRVKVASILNNEISKHFYYPVAAQRKHWQGQVILEFAITPNGTITNVEITTSSGYNILDNAALNALQQIDQQEQLASALYGLTIKHTLPVSYKLVIN